MKQTTLELIKTLKDTGEDFEFYPTTPELIHQIKCNIPEHCSFLDIGAGRGDVLKGVESKAGDLYAIEKSQTLIAELPAPVFVVGTDFERQTLIDKRVNVVFSNPPFSSFVPWTVKIIKEANAETILLVLPERWQESKEIQAALDARGATATSKGTFTFTKAERQARGNINLVRINLDTAGYHRTDLKSDPFGLWFEEEFKRTADEASYMSNYEERRKKQERLHHLVTGKNIIEQLEQLYINELNEIRGTYHKLADIPPDLLKEVGVEQGAVCGALKTKLEGLKSLYWQELFEHLDKITNRLTSTSREKMLKTLTANTYIDYSAENAYAVVIWAIKNANKYLDEQLVNVFKTLSNQDSAIAYKSNRHFNDISWRYCRRDDLPDGAARYKLDYRIVYDGYGEIFYNEASFSSCRYQHEANGGINDNAADVINDICTIGKNLGFAVMQKVPDFAWEPGKQIAFTYRKGEDITDFMSVRCYKNGNIHFKLNQDFLRKLNIEAARILGWINSPQQAAEEMDEKIKNVSECWNTSFKLTLNNCKQLIA